jgi:TRAP-type C4-dicarboxylate transport system substrate-binding protein
MSKTTKIRWVIAHEPLSLFYRAARDFEKYLNEQQNAENIEIEIMTLTEYSEKYNNGVVVTKHDLLDLMEAGKLEMSQMYTTWLAEYYDYDFLAFEMPYLFKDHDHAYRVLEGEIGETLLHRLTEKSNVRGLAYTYSGGFRCMGVNKPVSTLADLTGETLRSNRNPIGQEVVRVLSGGVEPFVCETEEAAGYIKEGKCNGNDTVYSRIYPLGQNTAMKSVVDSKHALFLTTMIIADSFWNTLSDEVKACIKDAALRAGRRERDTTIEDGQQARGQLESDGIVVYDPTDTELVELKEKMQVVYDKFESTFPDNMIDRIRKA